MLLFLIAPGSTQAQRLQALVNQSTIDRPLYSECKSTCTQKRVGKTQTGKKQKHKLAKHSGLPSDMKSVQGSKILADVRTDGFHSGPLTDQIIVDRFQYRARVIRTAGRDLGREFICQHKSPAKPDLGRQHTYTPSTCHSEDADSPVLHVLFSGLLFTFASWTWGGVDRCGHATNLYKTRSGFSKVAHLVSFCRV